MPNPAINRIYRKSEIINLTGLSSSTIDRLEKVGKFPKRIKLSPNRVGWLSSEIEKFISCLPRSTDPSKQENLDGGPTYGG